MEKSVKLIHLACVDSTNNYAKNLIAEGNAESGTLVIADEQTAGRGRLGRTFYSPGQTGLYMSLIYIPDGCDFVPSLFTVTAAVAVSRLLCQDFGVCAKIKWVNDIYIDSKKVCGILCEAGVDAQSGLPNGVVIGIGVNLTTLDFPDGLEKKAGAVLTGAADKIDTVAFGTKLAGLLMELLENPQKEIVVEYKERSMLIGRTVTVCPVIDSNEHNYTAKVIDITEEAKLKVQKEDGTFVFLDSGEVSLVL